MANAHAQFPSPGDSGLAMRPQGPRRRTARGEAARSMSAAPDRQDEGGPAEPAVDPDLGTLERIRNGDESALSELLTGYQERLFCVCLNVVRDRETASDLTQDAMVKIIGGLDQFQGGSKLSTWMIRVTVNVCLTYLRKQKLRRHASLDTPKLSGHDDPGSGRSMASSLADSKEHDAEHRVLEGEQLARLQAGLERLDPEQRTILILRDMQDLDYRQIGEVLDVPQGTVKSRLFRARVALREQIEQLANGASEGG